MEGDERRRQQYGQPYPPSSSARPSQPMPPPPDRFGPVSPSAGRVEGARTSTTRPYAPGYPGYGYSEHPYPAPTLHSSPMQGVELQYAPGYGADATRQQQLQPPAPYAAYGAGLMLPPGSSQHMYDAAATYPQRQQAAVEVLTTQFGLPQYLHPGDQSGVAGAAGSSPYVTSQAEPAAYPPPMGLARPGPPPFVPSSGDYPTGEPAGPPDAHEAEAAQTMLNESFRNYREQLKTTFGLVRLGRVSEASEKLVELSRWLIGSVVALDLHHDKPESHDSRLQLWCEFNWCWEALGLKQKDITEEALRSQRQPADVLSRATLIKMVDDLIALCDQIEPLGLVDYDLGVWEEQIVHLFAQCVDLLPREPAAGPSSS